MTSTKISLDKDDGTTPYVLTLTGTHFIPNGTLITRDDTTYTTTWISIAITPDTEGHDNTIVIIFAHKQP